MNEDQPTGGYDRCGARRRDGQTCRLPAGHGTDHPGYGRCRRHAGSTPTHVAAARRTQAQEAAVRFGVPVRTTPEAALVDLLSSLVGEVLFYRQQVAQLGPESMVHGLVERRFTGRAEDAQPGGPGWTSIQSKPNTWVVLLHDAEKRLGALAADMARLGIESRLAALAEAEGELMFRIIDTAIRAAGLDPSDEDRLREGMAAAICEVGGLPNE